MSKKEIFCPYCNALLYCEEADHDELIEKSDSDICKHACYLAVGDHNLKDWYRCHNPKSHMFNKSTMKAVCEDCPFKKIDKAITGGENEI